MPEGDGSTPGQSMSAVSLSVIRWNFGLGKAYPMAHMAVNRLLASPATATMRNSRF